MSMVGLTGSHRTGKSTLARDYAEKYNAAFLETAVSDIFQELGFDPSAKFDFSTRLTIQEKILERVDAIYGSADITDFTITDRTPIDMLAYTLAEAIGDVVSNKDQARLERYTERCFDVVNRRFSCLVLVQPAIPLVHAKGKAKMNKAYMEHLNSLMLGLMTDQRNKVANFYIRRITVGREDRVAALDYVIEKNYRLAEAAMDKYFNLGMRIQ